ncbi:phosphatidate cytidylyltransferase, mitochondrial isoform X1 [Sorex araneus]|uniref:phosphatidate cytidylyltransferase, mitochondrial isoform X1 n=1 Tax=Sorex araneus TaxID=42254 RepID=UPI002433F1B6|nr:phosphatidate cytidylyltransferase, mitochondrial isoform X1 [Sorex araneus]
MALQALPSSGVAFRRILAHFPEELSLAFAYGSGVFRQAGPSSSQKDAMLDFVFAVDDPLAWHSKNLQKNWSHYSFLKVLGPKVIAAVQSDYGAGVYYNTLVKCDGRLIKYGVISTAALMDDLLNWTNLYVAGRLQKPVKILALSENAGLRSALDKNLRSAVSAAFLMLPESFSEEDLFTEIAGLSYAGDFRMVVGEDKGKVANIVKPNIGHFRELYGDVLQQSPQVVYKMQQGRLEIDKSPEGQFTQLMTLPRALQQRINFLMDPPGKNRDVEETLLQVAHDPDCGDVVRLGRALGDSEAVQHDAERQRHLHRRHKEIPGLQLPEAAQNVERMAEENPLTWLALTDLALRVKCSWWTEQCLTPYSHPEGPCSQDAWCLTCAGPSL